MMHYAKGENIEQELTKEDLPFSDCMPKEHKDFLWMHVKGGTKVSNVINYAKAALEKGEYRSVVWSGVGGGVVKTVSCAEVIKRSLPLYQVTRIQYVTNEEHWVPQMQGLEEIVAKRQIPSIHILMSLDPIDDSIEGLQKPGTTTDYYHDASATKRGNQQQQQQPRQHGQQREGGPNVRGGRSNPSNRPPKRNNDNNRPQRPDQKPSDNAERAEKTTSQKLPTQARSSEQSAHLEQGSSNNPENPNQEQAKKKRNRNRKKKPTQPGESAGDRAQHKERREEAKQEGNKSACSSKSVENMES